VRAVDAVGNEVRASRNVIDWASAMRSVWLQANDSRDEKGGVVRCTVLHADWDDTGERSVSGYLLIDPTTSELVFSLTDTPVDAVSLGAPLAPRRLDSGVTLLQPITKRELAGIQPILGELWRAISDTTVNCPHLHGGVHPSPVHSLEPQAEACGWVRASAGMVRCSRFRSARSGSQVLPFSISVYIQLRHHRCGRPLIDRGKSSAVPHFS
jgi:hypothetical protein